MARDLGAGKWREWQRRMARFGRSQSSVLQFCRDEGVSVPTFYHWRKKLQQQGPIGEEGHDAAASFKPIRLVGSANIAVRLPGGTQVELPTHDVQILRLAIQLLLEADAEHCKGVQEC